MNITGAQLRKIVGGTAPLAEMAAEAFNQYADAFGINTPLRVAHFWAQIGHESALRYNKEIWGPTAAQKRYEGRADLGNTQPGDGKRFMGHGMIQVTGRFNHRAFTVWARKRYPLCPDFEANPEKLAEFPWALLSAIWYWDSRNLNALADKDDVLAITKKVNGGTNGLEDRKRILANARKEFANVKPSPIPALQVPVAPVTPAPVTPVAPPKVAYTPSVGLWERFKGLFS